LKIGLASVASEITYIVQERAFDFLDAPFKELRLLTHQHLFSSIVERMVAKC
jgi:pyruvate/2-oxoglutarate/acetoin dehydrogenase E1 component